MNLAVFTGNVGGTPRINQVSGATGPVTVLNFSLATQKGKKDPATGKPLTLWVDCSLWGARADALSQYIKSGSKLTVSGEVDVETYQAKDLTVQAKLTLRCSDIALQGESQPQSQQQAPAQQPAQRPQQQPQNRPSPGFHANGSAAPNNHQGAAQQPYNYNQQQSRGPAEPNIDFDDDIPF